MVNKPIVFISHVSEEKEMAKLIKDEIEGSFLNGVEVFVSSIQESLNLGREWFKEIGDKLKKCKIEIILASPKSLSSRWVWFEAGVGWCKDISVIPLCYAGMSPEQLPAPLSFFQSAKATDPMSLTGLFGVIADTIGLDLPQKDWSNFANKIKEIEEKYMIWDSIILFNMIIKPINPNIYKELNNI